MEKPPLEKVIEKLEKIDIQAWERDGVTFTARVSGLKVRLQVYKDPLNTTCSRIYIGSEDGTRQISYDAKNKTEKDMIKGIYEKTCKKYDELKDKEFGERLDNFLSE